MPFRQGLCALLFLAHTADLAAQETFEALVPIDAEGAVQVVDRKLAERIHLFDRYNGFQEARLYALSDTTFVLEVLTKAGDSLIKIRRELGSEEVETIRRTISERIGVSAPHLLLDQRGRTKLLIGSLALSLGYYGWAVPAVLDVEDSKSAAALYMLTSGLGFFVPMMVTRDLAVTDAAATLWLQGASRGIAYGILLEELLFGENGDEEARRKIGLGLLASLASGAAGFRIASRSEMTPGTAEVLSICGDFGLGWGAGAAHLGSLFEDDRDRAAAASMLLGTGFGYLSGKLLADREPYTRGDAYLLETSGLLGTYVAMTVGQLLGADSDDDRVGAALGGSMAGLVAGHCLVRGREFGTGQGTLVGLGSLAGGLVGLGVAYLVESEGTSDDARTSLYMATSSLGAATGFWAMYRSFAGGAYGSQDDSLQGLRSPVRGAKSLARADRGDRSWKVGIPLFSFALDF